MAPPPEQHANQFQSIRSSCERCRLQKLKCSVHVGSGSRGPCQRCLKSGVECIFAQRRRANRANTIHNHSPTRTRTRARAQTLSQSQSQSPSQSQSQSQSQSASKIQPLTSPQGYKSSLFSPVTPTDSIDSTHPLAPCSATEPSGWDDFQLPCLSFADLVSSSLHPSNHLDDRSFLWDLDQSKAGEPLPTPSLPSGDTLASEDNAELVHKLLAFLSDVEARIKALEAGPWQIGSANGLDNYPIGTLLHLSDLFLLTVKPVMEADTSNFCPENQDSGVYMGTTDAQLALLTLSGYLALTRMYGIALNHFQQHLSRLPNPEQGVTGTNGTSTALRLGELPCIHNDYRLGPIYTALCMLQASLGKVDGLFRVGGIGARDSVIGLLAKVVFSSSGEGPGCGNATSQRAEFIKGLVREKMTM